MKKTKYSHKQFSYSLSSGSGSTKFQQLIDKEETANIIFFLNSNKVSGSNNILFLLKNEIWKQFADLFKLSFMIGVFLSVLKTTKVVPVIKERLKVRL